MLALLFITLAFLAITSAKSNDTPIIGVFTQPTDSTDADCGGDCLYIAASYVKYLESAGARVVPINFYANTTEIDAIFQSVNGIFFTGGDADYPPSAQYAFDKVIQANDAGDFMPLWGTCMGFEWLLMGATRNASILDPSTGQMDAYNLSIALDFTSAAVHSRLFNDDKVYNILKTQPVTMNNHHYGIYPAHFMSTPALKGMYNVLSVNRDRQGVEFISTIEAFKYPIFGTQWHPEKNNFEFGKEDDGTLKESTNHSADAVLIAQYTANFFVNQARKNFHAFTTAEEEDRALIYNYPVTKTTAGHFLQEYHFKNDF